jgi:DNA-binding GntR family transcriptional regulator
MIQAFGRFVKCRMMNETPPTKQPLPRLSRVALRDQVANAVRDAILLGRLRPGEKIPEQQLAHDLGVSRVPVREAIRILEQQGILVTRPKNGTYVARPTPQELDDGMRVRAALEQLAVEQALERMSPTEWNSLCGQLQDLLGRMREAVAYEDWPRVTEADMEWHTVIVDSAQNSVLSHFWRVLGLPIRFMALSRIRGNATPERYAQAVGHHEELLAVLRGRDLGECRQAVRVHVLRHVTH